MNEWGMELLREAIVRRALQDYLEALRIVHRYPNKKNYYCEYARRTIAECERFFRTDCDRYMDVDGVMLMETVKEKSWDRHFWIRREE